MRTRKERDDAEDLNDLFMRKVWEKTSLFILLERRGLFSVLDYDAVTRDGRKAVIESKVRTSDVFKYDRIFIEENKYDALRYEWAGGTLPLYFNFFQTADELLIWDMRKYFDGTLTEPDRVLVDIDNRKCYDRVDYGVARYMLPTWDAIYYRFNQVKGKYERI